MDLSPLNQKTISERHFPAGERHGTPPGGRPPSAIPRIAKKGSTEKWIKKSADPQSKVSRPTFSI